MVIRPRIKQALAFEWPGAPAGMKPGKDGRFVFKSVTRPAITIPAQPYLRPAISESKREIRTIIIKSVIGAIKS
jgi:hypothetical protein